MSCKIPYIIRYKPRANLINFGQISTKIPTIMAKTADIVNDSVTILTSFLIYFYLLIK